MRGITITYVVVAAFVMFLATLRDQLPMTAVGDRHHLVAALVTLAGSALLLTFTFTRRTWRPAVFVVLAAGGVVGAALSLLMHRETACCAMVFGVHDGYPFPWRSEHMEFAENVALPQARSALEARGPGAKIDVADLAADVIFWGYAALLAATPLLRKLTR